MAERSVKRIMLMLAVFFPVTEVIKQAILLGDSGGYQVWYFPFQLCSMPIYLLPLAVLTQKEEMRRLLLCFLGDFMLVGGIAVLFDTSGLFYEIPILTFHSFLWHRRMVLLALLILSGRDYVTSTAMMAKETAIYLLLAFIALILNCFLSRFGPIDMFYISPFTRMRQVVFSDIASVTGDPVAKIIYMLATVLAAAAVKQTVKMIRLRRR